MEERVGPYVLTGLLAAGASGAVHRARRTDTGQEAAVKILRPDLSDDPDFVARFRREARALAVLEHPHIVRVLESGAGDGRYFIAMELMPGGSLQGRLDAAHRARLALPVAHALSIARQIAEGLAYAHARGITHRDVKPANVLIAEDGRHALADFGIAAVVGATQLTAAHTTLGTPLYMSPEQAQGLPADPRSDLYSLGVMLFEMLARRPPFLADTSPALLYKHIHEPPPGLGDEIPAAARALVARLLAKRPEDRPQRAEDVIAALDRAMPGPARPTIRRALAPGVAIAVTLGLATASLILAPQLGGPMVPPGALADPTALPTPSALASRSAVTLTVMASRDWQSSGIAFMRGEAFRIRVAGGAWSECVLGGCPFHGAEGDMATRAQFSNAVQGCPHASLVAMAGEGTPFCAGAALETRADAAGELRLRINDTILFDNDGSLIVVIERRPSSAR